MIFHWRQRDVADGLPAFFGLNGKRQFICGAQGPHEELLGVAGVRCIKAVTVTASMAAGSFGISCRSRQGLGCLGFFPKNIERPGRVGAKRRRALRASPRAVFAVTAIRLQSLTQLRAVGAARPAPRHVGRTWRIRQGLLRQVARMRAVLDAGGSLPGRHEGRFTQVHGPPGLAGHPHRATSRAAAGYAGAHCPVRR